MPEVIISGDDSSTHIEDTKANVTVVDDVVNVTLVEETVGIVDVGTQGPEGVQGPEGPDGPTGPQGPLGNDAYYHHVQGVASNVWTILHNLGKIPTVSVIDTGGNTVFGQVQHQSTNQLTVAFTSAFSGDAYLN